ncbi:MAG: hypothetical protein KY391_05525 [Actinobacteria bacterium]|nr:hypothetical protein [Actinomycetota bacterium]
MEIKGVPTDLATGETCVGCGDDLVLVAAGEGTASVQCGCSSATVLVAA